ncbi:MAG: transposase [Bacteroidota bacterium]|nr:transposase [Bacteroidota bacterium]
MVKHTREEFNNLALKLREKGFYKPKEKRKIDWNAYTLNQINDIIDTLYFIRINVDKIHTPTSNRHKPVGRPATDAGILAKSILFVELFGIPERKSEGWLMIIGHQMGIHQRIDDRVLGKAYKRHDVIRILESVFLNNRSSDGNNCGDGTGLEKSRKENYETTKKKNLYMTSVVDSREIVLAFDISGKQECRIMHLLVLELKKIIESSGSKELKVKLTLDAGFVDRKLAQLIEDSGLTPYIFPKKNLTLKSRGSPAWRKMWLNLLNSVQEWLQEYHIRSHSESFHSSFKRIFGIITKDSDESTYTQVLCRIIHNNRRKLNYFQMASL